MRPKSTKVAAAGAVPTSRRSIRLASSAGVGNGNGNGSGDGEENKKRTADVIGSSTSKSKKPKTKIDSKAEDAKAEKEVKEVEQKSSKSKSKSKADTAATKSEPTTVPKVKLNKDEDEEKEDKTKLKKGDKLPTIKLEDEQGQIVDVSKMASGNGNGVVIFVYPKADTPGCTNQACGFRDHLSEIKELGYEIYGLSKDKPAALKRWKVKKELNYTLLSDPQSKLIKRLGAFIHPNNSCRSHFIFDPKGHLVDIAIKVKPADDPKNCLEFIKKLPA